MIVCNMKCIACIDKPKEKYHLMPLLTHSFDFESSDKATVHYLVEHIVA